MRVVYKRTLQLSSKVIVEHLQLDQIYTDLDSIKGIENLLDKVKNANRNDGRAAAIGVLLSGVQFFDDSAYETFVNAAGVMSEDILEEILNNTKVAEEEVKQEEIRRQRLAGAFSASKKTSPSQNLSSNTAGAAAATSGATAMGSPATKAEHLSVDALLNKLESLSDVQRKDAVKKSLKDLSNDLDIAEVLIHMETEDVVSRGKRAQIMAGTTFLDHNRALIDHVQTSSKETFIVFVKALLTTGQKHLARVIADNAH